MAFHRLATPTYLGGLPAGFDYINNAISGTPAGADGAKGSGTNAGTYFVAFGEDATSANFNRSNQALAENCDFLDDAVSGQLPILAELQGTAGGSTSQLQLTGLSVYVGPTTYTGTSEEIDRLIKILNTDGDEMYDPVNGQKITVNQILDSTNTSNVVGQEASNFHTSPWLSFVPDLPAGDYRIVYGGQSTLVKVAADLTDSDGITRSILGSHIVPAAANRFFLETSRRDVGGSVEALVTDRIETPGNGDNIGTPSSALDVHLDPADTFTNRSFVVESGTALNNMLTLAENTAAGQLRVTSAYELVFNDANITFDHPLTSVTNGPSIRTGEIVPSSSSEVKPIFDAINSRWTVTCGNGTDTFGDFNGASAISDAVTWYKTYAPGRGAEAYGNGLTILLKAGEYEASDIDIEHALGGGSTGTSVIIEGVGGSEKSGMVRIKCMVTASFGGFIVGASSDTDGSPSSELILKNVVTIPSANGGARLARLNEGGSMYLENCYCDATNIFVSDSRSYATVLRAKKCKFNGTDNKTYAPATTGAFFSGGALIGLNSILGSAKEEQSLIFEDCVFTTYRDYPVMEVYYGPSPARDIDSIIFDKCRFYLEGKASSSNPNGTAGIFQTNYLSGSTDYSVRNLVFRDCTVRAGLLGATSDPVFLELNQKNASALLTFEHVVIEGGSWIAEAGIHDFTPFYIGGVDYDDFPGVSRVTIRDVDIGYAGTASYGPPPSYVTASELTYGWGALFISTTVCTTIENVRFLSSDVVTRSGELFLRPYAGSVRVNNVVLGEFTTATGTELSPRHRVFVDASQVADIEVHLSNVSIKCSIGLFTGTGDAVSGIAIIPSGAGKARIENCRVDNYQLDSADSFWVDGSGSIIYGVDFSDCWVNNAGRNGIHIEEATVTDVSVSGCRSNACDGSGIYVKATTLMDRVSLLGNFCSDNAYYGIHLDPDAAAWGSASVNNNVCVRNAVSAPAVQHVQIRIENANDSNCSGTLLGNTCDANATNAGTIYFNGVAPGGAGLMVGAVTNYTSDIPVFGNQLLSNGIDMLYNDAESKLI